MKIYLAGAISDIDRKEGQRQMAEKLRALGHEVYAASENDSINDKSNNPTPTQIYLADIEQLLKVDVMVVRIAGGSEDGTLCEIGVVAGWNERLRVENNQRRLKGEKEIKPILILAYSTNERLMNPDISQGIPSAGFNHLVLGTIQKWGGFLKSEEELFRELENAEEFINK